MNDSYQNSIQIFYSIRREGLLLITESMNTQLKNASNKGQTQFFSQIRTKTFQFITESTNAREINNSYQDSIEMLCPIPRKDL